MKLILFYSDSCYPCERAKKVMRQHFAHLNVISAEKNSLLGKVYSINSTPTLYFLDDEDNLIKALHGAHVITKVEVQGVISDYFNC